MNGWIKLHVDFLNWEWYQNNNTKALFLHCLLKANWKGGKFEGEIIPRGSFVTGRKVLAKELQMTEQEIRTALEHLISTKEITKRTTNKFTIISVTNYELYQQINQINNQRATNEQPTNNQQTTTREDNSMYVSSSLERIYARAILPTEYEKIKYWLTKYDKDLIVYALEVSVMNNRKRVDYVNGILKNWEHAGYKTKQDVLDNEKKIEEERNKEPVGELFDYNWLEEN